MPLKWFGTQAKAHVRDLVGRALRNAGEAWVDKARELAPVKTGFLKSSIGYAYNVSKLKLTLYCNASYAAFQEWGTPKTPAHPFMRPALSAISRFLRGSAVLQVAETPEANQSDVKNRANAGSGGTRVEVGHGDFE